MDAVTQNLDLFWSGFLRSLTICLWGAVGSLILGKFLVSCRGAPGAPPPKARGRPAFVHNPPRIARIGKCVVRHPAVGLPKPPYCATHRTAHTLGRRLTYMEEDNSWLHLPGVIAAAVRA